MDHPNTYHLALYFSNKAAWTSVHLTGSLIFYLDVPLKRFARGYFIEIVFFVEIIYPFGGIMRYKFSKETLTTCLVFGKYKAR